MLYAETPKYIFAWVDEGQPVELMQFTGLLDKNGKEIYEGDILKYRGKLSFNDPPFVVEWQNDDARWTEFYPSNNFEVIGNIYENPELLK